MGACNACGDGSESTEATRGRPAGFERANRYVILRKQVFDFSFLAPSSSTTITLRRGLWLGNFYYLWYGVRIHNKTIDSGSFVLDAFQTLPSREDPAEFTQSSSIFRVTVTASDTPPKLEAITEEATFGPYVKFLLNANQGAAGGSLYAELSAVLLARAV